MNLKVPAPISVFENSLAAARASTMPKINMPKGASPAVLDAALMGKLSQLWDGVEKMLWRGYLQGRAAAEDLLSFAAAGVASLLDEAGVRANLAQAWLQQRVHEFAQTFIAGALAMVPCKQVVSGIPFILSTFKCAQKINLAGNLKASLTDLLGLVCEGEINIEANYIRE